jgi:hypothetical protein
MSDVMFTFIPFKKKFDLLYNRVGAGAASKLSSRARAGAA